MLSGESALVERKVSAPAVVFIAGSGRSGSTLLERTLGAIPGYVNIGEAIDIPRGVVADDELCGCGLPFSACPFWSEVSGHLDEFGAELSAGWLAETHRLQATVARQRHLPRLLAPTRDGAFEADIRAYADRYLALYRAVSEISGDDVLVDASKWPSLALALWRGGVDVRVVHLVRDARGVAYSLDKTVARPQSENGKTMYHNRPASGAARWLATQTEMDAVAARGVPVARMMYADFVADPAQAVRAALEALQLPVPPGGLDHIDGRVVSLGPSHGVSGNPSRFRHGAVTLRDDDEWRRSMTRGARIVASVVSGPQLVRYSLARRGPEVLPASSTKDDGPAPGSWPLVTVVLPTHGRPELVRESIESVVAQAYPGDIECLVVHDREAADLGQQELGRPGRDVQVLVNTRTPGLAGARNTGVELAKGAFIASLDDDDTWHTDKVEAQVRRFLCDPDILMLGAGIRLLLAHGATAEWPGRADRIPHDLLLRNRVKELHSSTLMMRRDVFAKAGLYDEELPNGYGEDWDFVLRVARVGTVGVVREPLADIRKNGGSYYIAKAERTVVALQVFLDKHPEIAADRRGHARILGQLAYQRAALGERREAVAVAVKAITRWPVSPHPWVALMQAGSGVDPARIQKLARRLGRGMA